MPNHTAALVATLTKPRARTTTPASASCRVKAPCGGKCCLDATVRHGLHCCNDEECALCHGAERYQDAKEAQKANQQERNGATK